MKAHGTGWARGWDPRLDRSASRIPLLGEALDTSDVLQVLFDWMVTITAITLNQGDVKVCLETVSFVFGKSRQKDAFFNNAQYLQ